MQVHPEKTSSDLVNFCIQPFVTQVTTTSVCADDHAPSTLAALSPTVRSQGFMVERYVRPPVCLSFKLAVPVGVSCLLLSPDLNTQTEMRFEISVCGGRGSVDQQVYHGTVHGNADSRDTVLALLNPRTWDRSMAAQRMSSTQVLGSYAGATLHTGTVHECWMRHSPVLSQCHQVCVNIIRWTGVKPVSLKWVELWGRLATGCSKSELVTYQRGCCMLTDRGPVCDELNLPHFFASDPENPVQPESLNDRDVTGEKASCVRGSVVAVTCSDVVVSGEAVDKSVAGSGSKARDVPIQLLDEITFEVMELPMVLPSGRCVDASTLDKLAAADAACGRPPTDPFTGLAFTEQCRPEFSVHVKGQLDEWQSACLRASKRPRSVGCSRHIHNHLHRNRHHPCSSGDVPPSAKKPKKSDIGSKFPDRVEKWSLSNHTPFTGLDCGRMNSSPSPSHSSSLTLSKSAFPERGSPVSESGAVLTTERFSPVPPTPSKVSHLRGAAVTSNQSSNRSTSCVSVATSTRNYTTNKSFDSQVEQSLNQALSDIFDYQSST